jgi:hypothetical protein
MDTEKAFDHGRDAGLLALDKLGEIFDGDLEHFTPTAMTGLLVTVMSCVYAHAPHPEAADELIATARKWADEAVEGKNPRSTDP